MEKINKRIIILSLVLSLITAALIYIYISSNKAVETQKVEYATVYAAARTIPARAEIIASDIKKIQIAKELLDENALTDIGEITGKRTLQSIIEGEVIRKERLSTESSTSASYIIPNGTRAISMDVSEQVNVAHLVRPGDFVDVIASFEKEEETVGDTSILYSRITKTILQNVQVLALGQNLTITSEKLSEPPTTITLAIKEAEVEKFVYASEYGILRLALRPVGDANQHKTQGAVRSDMTSTKGVYIRSHVSAEQ